MIPLRKLLVLAALLWSVPALAQNPNCPDVSPSSDSSNRCANTRFVQQNKTGPGGTNGQIQYNNAGSFGGRSLGLGLGVGGGGNIDLQPSAPGVIGGVQSLTCGAGMFVSQLTSGVLTCATPANARIVLNTATNFYVATAGTDTVGCGIATGAAACRTRQYLVASVLATLYDLNNQTVTINLVAGTYTDSFQWYSGLLRGQAGAGSLIFTGDCTSGHTSDVIIRPAASVGYAYGIAFGGGFRVQCQKVDNTTQVRAGAAAGADMFVANQGARLLLGNPSLFGVRKDMSFGCNIFSFNVITVAFQGYVEFDNDFDITVSDCQVVTTGTTTSGSGTISSVASTTNVVANMNIVASGIPSDAYVVTAGGGNVTIGCIYTSPCQASASASGVSLTFTGGGQTFLNMASGSTGYFATNGEPDFAIEVTLGGFPFYASGFFLINTQSSINAQSVTFINPGQARGKCPSVKTLSNIDTNFQGIPYLPCNAQQQQVNQSSVALTAGSSTFTVSSATGISRGMIVTDVAVPTATWTAGTPNLVVSSASGVCIGAKVNGAGIQAGAIVTNVVGTTISVGGCGPSGPKCVGGYPTYQSGAGVTVYFSNCLMTGSSIVTNISGTTITISDTPKSSATAPSIWFQGSVTGFSVYD